MRNFRVRELRVCYGPQAAELAASPAPVSSGAKAAAYLRPLLEDEPVEVVGVLCLTTRLVPIGWHEISRGTLDGTLVHPREAFKAAILTNAAGIILAHNHPSGDPTPSSYDDVLTKRLREAGELLGIPVHDHVILGEGSYYSYQEKGRF
jgi:DNA repair protein RadC